MATDPQALKATLDAIDDPMELAQRKAALLSQHDQAISEALLSNPYVEGEQLFVPGQIPPECPWQLDPSADVAAWIDHIWAPLKDQAPGFLAALKRACKAMVARRRGDLWELMYVLLCDDEQSMAVASPDSFELLPTWIGGPPNPSPQLPSAVEAAGWSLPASLRQFYSIHDGFGCGLSAGVEAIEPVRNLELLNDAHPERLVIYCDSVGNRRLFWRNPLQPERAPLTLDWDHETWELAAPRTLYQFLDWDIACEMLAFDPATPPQPMNPLPALGELDELAIMWSDVPLAPLDGAEVKYLYQVEVAFSHPLSAQVPELAPRWREVFLSQGWSLEGEASLKPEDHAELRFRKSETVIELVCERCTDDIIVYLGRERDQGQPADPWDDYPLVMAEETGALLRSTFMDPVEHAIIGYPLAQLDDIRQRWLQAFAGWECSDDSGRCLYLQRDDKKLVVSLRQEPLSVEVMVFEGWGEPLPEAFGFLTPHLNSPVFSECTESGSKILDIVWVLSNFARDHGTTRARRDLQRYIEAFQQEGWSCISRFQGFLGPSAWLRKGPLWAHPNICHLDGYEGMLYLRYVESQEPPEAWRTLWEEAGLHDGFWLEADDGKDRWAMPWPADAERLLPAQDAIARCNNVVKEALEAVGWRTDDTASPDETQTFQRQEECIEIQLIPDEDTDWIELYLSSR